MTLQLRHLDINDLIGSAGGDPWELNRTIQAGAPGEISDLATAFRAASNCTQETTDEFVAAKKRFESAWDRHDGGDHPINDSNEVRRATESMNYNRDKMAKVAADLQNVAASLAEAQRSGAVSISNLDATLKSIDNQIDYELGIAAANGETVDVSELRQAAVDRTATSLGEVSAVRDAYSHQLDESRAQMAAEGYTPDATNGADGRGLDTEPGAQSAADKYDAGQRAADQALVNSPGAWSPEKEAAAGRLRDFATVNDPTANIDEIRYAGQRLGDFHMAHQSGPLPTDPVMGGDARTRAQTRQEWQQRLERGFMGTPAMTPDKTTEWLNRAEAGSRQLVLDRFQEQLQRSGMTPEGAAATAEAMAQGVVPQELVDLAQNGSKVADGESEAYKHFSEKVPTGDHWKPGIAYSPEDIAALKRISNSLGGFGTVLDGAVALYEINNGVPVGEVASKLGGGMAGAWLGAEFGAWVGSRGGPVGVFVGALVGGVAGSFGGEWVGQQGYQVATK
ncbi:MAG: hypothetical protein ACJ74F_27855 [Mycobacterium sp.]|uniref:putative alpha/beta hydrolase n=1 Tax=Mycobacterium sp. TaxID=1785 RepID=UPI00389998BE